MNSIQLQYSQPQPLRDHKPGLQDYIMEKKNHQAGFLNISDDIELHGIADALRYRLRIQGVLDQLV